VISIDDGFRERLSRIIKDSGMKKREFAAKIGSSPSSISDIIVGRTKRVSGLILKALELAIFVNTNWLLTGQGEPYVSTVLIASPLEDSILFLFRGLDKERQNILIQLCEAYKTVQVEE